MQSNMIKDARDAINWDNLPLRKDAIKKTKKAIQQYKDFHPDVDPDELKVKEEQLEKLV